MMDPPYRIVLFITAFQLEIADIWRGPSSSTTSSQSRRWDVSGWGSLRSPPRWPRGASRASLHSPHSPSHPRHASCASCTQINPLVRQTAEKKGRFSQFGDVVVSLTDEFSSQTLLSPTKTFPPWNGCLGSSPTSVQHLLYYEAFIDPSMSC